MENLSMESKYVKALRQNEIKKYDHEMLRRKLKKNRIGKWVGFGSSKALQSDDRGKRNTERIGDGAVRTGET